MSLFQGCGVSDCASSIFLTITQTKPWAECYASDFEEQSQNRPVTTAVESILSTENRWLTTINHGE